MLTYDQLTIRVEPAAEPGSYEVIAQGAGGEAHGTFTVPFEARDVENFVLRMSRGRRSTRRIETSDARQAKEFGGRLFDALFQGEVRDVYLACRAGARHGERGLRLTFALTKAPELMDLPWEFLFDEPDFLSASVWTPVVRYLDVARPATPLAVPPPLRVLGMISRADDLPELDVDGERRRLEAALRPLRRTGRVELYWTPEATLESLLRKLRTGDFHIFHFIGHGAYDEARDDGLLLLRGADGRAQEVTGERLAQILDDHHPMRLAVLNACEGARSSESDPFAGVAASLVRRGLPAVVAMQFEITDTAAVTFAEHFYSALTLGYPVDAAVAEARLGIYASGNDVEWGTPVLFLRPADGRIFDLRWEDARSEGPSLTASLEAHPAEAAAGEPVTWSLYVQNTGKPSLFDVAPRGVPGCEPTELMSGEDTVFEWVDEAGTAERAVVVEASTSEGTEVRATATGRHEVVRAEPEPEPVTPPVAKPKPEPKPKPKPKPMPVRPAPPRSRRPDRRVAIGAAALAALVVIAIVLLGGGGDDSVPEAPAETPGPAEAPPKVPVPDNPNGMTFKNGRLWVSTKKGVVGVTASGRRIDTGRRATQNAIAITGDKDSLWVVSRDPASVVQLSSHTGEPSGLKIPTEGEPKAIALSTDDEKVYVAQADQANNTWVQAYSTADGHLAGARLPAPLGAKRLTVRGDMMWVLAPDVLRRYALPSGTPMGEVKFGDDAASAMSHDDAGGGFWVALYTGKALVFVKDATAALGQRVPLGGHAANVRVDEDRIWVTMPDEGTLLRVERRDTSSRKPYHPGPRPYSLTVTDDRTVWVGDTQTDNEYVRLVDP